MAKNHEIRPAMYPNGIATVCFISGNCYVISRIMIDGNWQNACCADLPPALSCTDDCNLALSGPQGQGFENTPNFDSQPSNIDLGGGNEAWIYKNNNFLVGQLAPNSDEAIFLNGIPNFDFINDADDVDFVSIKINDTTFALVNKSEIALRKKSGSDEISFFENFEENLKNKYALHLVPNPTEKNNTLKIFTESKRKIKSVKMINSRGGKMTELEIISQTKKGCEVFIDNITSGIYLIEVKLETGTVLKEKLIIK